MTIIHCDSCHHEFEGDPAEHHNISCEYCGAILIDDEDLSVWYEVLKLEANGIVSRDLTKNGLQIKINSLDFKK